MFRSKSRSGYLEFGHKKKNSSSSLLRTISGSKFCRGEVIASQVDKQALVSSGRSSISLSENRIVKAAMMQKQMGSLEQELKNTKERLGEAESERIRVISELREVKERAFSELKSLEDSLLSSKKEVESRDNEIRLLSNRVESAKVFEAKLGERDGFVEELKKRVVELEEQVVKAKKLESNMMESLRVRIREFEQARGELEDSKIKVVTLAEKVKNLQKDNENRFDQKDEIVILKNELKLATEAEEKSKKAMDDLALALREVATEASKAKENLKSSEEQVFYMNEKIKQLNRELELQKNKSERLKSEAEESILAWTAKELGFISCIRKADEENTSLKHDNNKLNEALVAAEDTMRIMREETFKLRDILKQTLNESVVAKEGCNIARSEDSELKDLLAKKEEFSPFSTKEDGIIRINEVVASENVKEFERLPVGKALDNKPCEDNEQIDVFNSPVSSLYESGRSTPQQMFSFDLDDMKMLNKEENGTMFDKKDDSTESDADEALGKSSRLEPQNSQTKVQHQKDLTGYVDFGGSGRVEEVKYISNGNHTEDSEDNGSYMYGLYNRKKLFRKIEELIVGKSNSKKEGLIDQGKEQSNEQVN